MVSVHDLSANRLQARSVPSPKKKKPRQAAKALTNLSTNAPRNTRASRAKKAITTAASPQKRQMTSMQAPPNPFVGNAPVLNPLANFDRRYIPSVEEDDEFRLTVGDMTKKRGFSIFQDIPEHPEASPGRTETPLEDHRYIPVNLPRVCQSTDQPESQLRVLQSSRLAYISEQFDELDPYPCFTNTSSQTNIVPNQWQRERSFRDADIPSQSTSSLRLSSLSTSRFP